MKFLCVLLKNGLGKYDFRCTDVSGLVKVVDVMIVVAGIEIIEFVLICGDGSVIIEFLLICCDGLINVEL